MRTCTINNFNTQKPIQSKVSGMKPAFGVYVVMPEDRDFFDTDEGKATKNTGYVLGLGFVIRSALQKWSGKLFSNYFANHPNVNKALVVDIANNMKADKTKKINNVGIKNLRIFIESAGQNAYFDPCNNVIRVTKDTLISLPHEIGHAVEEHGSKVFKFLQRNRGNATILALVLYGLGRSKPTNKKGEQTPVRKIQNTLYKFNALVPLIAFSPELITEFKASKIGVDYIKKYTKNVETQLKQNSANKALIQKLTDAKAILKAAKKHYAIAFCTYLALPVFAMMDNFIFKQAMKN